MMFYSRIILSVCFLLIWAGDGFAQRRLETDLSKSTVRFKIRNLGVSVTGKFENFSGEIEMAATEPLLRGARAKVLVGSLETGIQIRDNHLRKPEYFDQQKYPEILFESVSVEAGDQQGKFIITGRLTIKGTVKTIRMPVSLLKEAEGYRFNAEFSMNRRDYGVGGGSISLSDNLTVSLSVFARQAKDK